MDIPTSWVFLHYSCKTVSLKTVALTTQCNLIHTRVIRISNKFMISLFGIGFEVKIIIIELFSSNFKSIGLELHRPGINAVLYYAKTYSVVLLSGNSSLIVTYSITPLLFLKIHAYISFPNYFRIANEILKLIAQNN